jgi:hypothetical protein
MAVVGMTGTNEFFLFRQRIENFIITVNNAASEDFADHACNALWSCPTIKKDFQDPNRFPKRFPHKRRLQHVSNARPAIVELRKLPECRFAGMLDVICVELRYTVLSQIRSDKSASIIP